MLLLVQVMAFKVTLKTPSGEETIEVDGEGHSPCKPMLPVCETFCAMFSLSTLWVAAEYATCQEACQQQLRGIKRQGVHSTSCPRCTCCSGLDVDNIPISG